MKKDSPNEVLTVIDRDMGSSDNGESLGVYMKALQKLPLLKKEEEINLARQIKSSKTAILQLCQEVPECVTELYLLRDLPVTELRKLFFLMLEEEGEDQVNKLLKQMTLLLTNRLKNKKDSEVKLVEFLNMMNFTLNDLHRISKPVLESGSKDQITKLNKQLAMFLTSKKKMIEGNLRLVFSRAKLYLNKGLSLEDLLQEGNIGLIKAIEKYDVEKGYKFGTYATWWIDQALGRAVADKGRLIRIPVHMVENINRITKVSRNLTQKLGRNPKIEEISAGSDLSEEKINKVKKVVSFPHSIEEPTGDIGVPLSEYLIDQETPDPYSVLERKEIAQKVRLLLSKLPPREEKIMRMRFGIGEKRPAVLDTIGKNMNLTRERVRQIVNASIAEMDRISKRDSFKKEWKVVRSKT